MTATPAARRGPALPLAIAAVTVAVVVAAAFVVHAWYEQAPPALESSGPGTVFRLIPETGGIPPPRYGIRLAGGSSTEVSLVDVGSQGGRATGTVDVAQPGGTPTEVTLGEGQSAHAAGVTLTVLHVWRMPDATNDALDVRVVPDR